MIAVCRNYDVRLSGGSTASEGLVELCKDGQWGSICQNFWDSKEARVVCRQLGYESQSAVAMLAYGRGSDLIHQTYSECNGDEYSLLHCQTCTTCGIDAQTCQHSSNVGVSCFPNGDYLNEV